MERQCWRASERKVKVVKLLKKALGTLSRMFSSCAAPTLAQRRHQDNDLAFMTCILKVKSSRQGWQRSVLAVLKNCKGVQFRMDGEGMVEVNAMVEADKVLRRIGRSTTLELQWIQFGQCSSFLFMPQTTDQKQQQQDHIHPQKQNPQYPYPYPPHRLYYI